MKRTLIAGTVYFLLLFSLGFALGTLRVTVIAPKIGELAATLTELPIMLAAAIFICRRVIMQWQLPSRMDQRWLMVLWFLALLVVFETGLGVFLFGRTLAEQWAAVTTIAGLLGLASQLVAAALPLFVGRDKKLWHSSNKI